MIKTITHSKLERYLLKKKVSDFLEKADKSHLVKKKVTVTRAGKTFQQTVYVREDIEVGEQITGIVDGLDIIQYSDKSIAIGGETYAKIDLMREIKFTLGVGGWNRKLKSWIFPSKYRDEILGLVYSDLKDKGNNEGAEAVKNQKNESLKTGDSVDLSGTKATIEEGASNSEGTKYNIKLEDGTKLDGVNEKVITTTPETNDKKLAETTGNTTAENRLNTDKKIYGIKPIEDIYNYSLSEYLGMHGLDESDIQKVINSLSKPKKESTSSSSGSGKPQSLADKQKIHGLTKRQLIAKLIYAHYQAVKGAIDSGKDLQSNVLATYKDLEELHNKKKKVLSEEHKRKIAEALRKNKDEEAKKAAQEMIDNLSEKDLDNLKDAFKDAVNKVVGDEQKVLAEMVVELEKLKKQKQDYYNQSHDIDVSGEKMLLSGKARELSPKIIELEIKVRSQKNKVQVIENGGDISTVTDKVGIEHKSVPNFTKISSENIIYDIDSILTAEKPLYIPDINEEDFERGSYIFDTIRVDKNTYILATNKHRETSKIEGAYTMEQGRYHPEQGGYVLVTLDQLVLTQDYYTTKKKAQLKQRAAERNQRSLDQWNAMTDASKEKYMTQKYLYRSVPAKVKKKVTEEQWDKMPWQERETYYKPIKKYGVERLKSRFDEYHMANSFHSMYERFVDPTAERHTKDGKKLKRAERSYSKSYAHEDAWNSWQSFRQMLDWKINDINIQREEISNLRSKAIETSFGMSGTNASLLETEGVLVKRQNGDEIKVGEIEQLKNAWVDVQKSFGSLKENAKQDNLKLSHTGEKHIFASKAIGVYVPRMKTIGVTAKLGEDQLGFTMGHEVAHWIDHTLGVKDGMRHVSDDYESTAGKIAIAFRQGMNKQSNSKYINATHECFARAMEQYHAIESQGKNAIRAARDEYIMSDSYVSLEKYNNTLKPLITQFFEENKTLLKSIGIDIGKVKDYLEKAQKLPIGTIRKWQGVEMRKVSETGNKDADWKPTKGGGEKSKQEGGQKSSKSQSISGHAKQTSEQALQEAVKRSNDPKVREAAHQELDRRQKEEHVQEEDKSDGVNDGVNDGSNDGVNNKKDLSQSKGKKEEKPSENKGKPKKEDKPDINTTEGIEDKIKELRAVDTDDLPEIEKISDEIQDLLKKRKDLVEKEKGLRKVDFEEYRKGFKDLSQESNDKTMIFYKGDSKGSAIYLEKHPEKRRAINSYIGDGYEKTREYLSNPKEYVEDDKYSKFNIVNISEDISKFIKSNKISENLSLNRRVKGEGIKFFKELTIGDVYEDVSFSSSSILELDHFGDFNIEVLAKKGSDVANANNEGEREYLIDKGSKFRVLDKQDKGIIVELL